MSTYNAVTRNDSKYLKRALNSLLKQTDSDFELHILDNISTDETPNICKEFAIKDDRIKFKIDTKRRFPEARIEKLAYGITTKYIMVANYDDLWNHYYIESLFKILDQHSDIALAYSNGTFIDHKSINKNPLLYNTNFTYNHTIEQNFCFSIQHRNIIPLLFGIFKTTAYQTALLHKSFDSITTNNNDLFLAKFFLYGYKAKLYNKPLFHYRGTPKNLFPETVKGIPNNPALIWVYYIQQQLKFYSVVSKYIPDEKPLLKIATLDSCFHYLLSLLIWTINNLAHDAFEENLLKTIYKKYENICRILFKDSFPEMTDKLYKNHYRKCYILSEQILPYVNSMLVPNPLIDNTIQLAQKIHDEKLQPV